MSTAQDTLYRPACQARTAAECSNCPASYDCVRARSGRSISWPLVVIVLALVVGGLIQLF